MTLETKIKKLEEKIGAKDNKIFVMIFGDDGRVQYGSDELKGMTLEEVTAYTGGARVINVIPASEDKAGDE